MTNEEAVKMLEAKLECMRRDVSGIDDDCNRKLCDECHLCYDQGNMGEQQEYLRMSIKSLKQEPCKDGWIPTSVRLPEVMDGANGECSDDVLICVLDEDGENYTISTGFYGYYPNDVSSQGWYCVWIDGCHQLKSKYKVIAWRELPEPYVPDINVGSRK